MLRCAGPAAECLVVAAAAAKRMSPNVFLLLLLLLPSLLLAPRPPTINRALIGCAMGCALGWPKIKLAPTGCGQSVSPVQFSCVQFSSVSSAPREKQIRLTPENDNKNIHGALVPQNPSVGILDASARSDPAPRPTRGGRQSRPTAASSRRGDAPRLRQPAHQCGTMHIKSAPLVDWAAAFLGGGIPGGLEVF